VDMHRWWSGHRVLVPSSCIYDVSWSMARVSVAVTRLAIKGAPPYDSDAPLDRQREQALHDHYDTPAYWAASTRPRHQAHTPDHEAVRAGRRR
jgi:hypothetical protein